MSLTSAQHGIFYFFLNLISDKSDGKRVPTSYIFLDQKQHERKTVKSAFVRNLSSQGFATPVTKSLTPEERKHTISVCPSYHPACVLSP